MTEDSSPQVFPTSIGTSDAATITLLGQDLASDLLGKVGFAELALWLATLRRPAPGQVRLFEAVLVALADHGLTPSAIAARLTLLGAPESAQGAMAAGLLGGGSRYLGVTEDTGRFLAETLRAADRPANSDADFDEIARRAVERLRAEHALVPGLGHPVHKHADPRTAVIIDLADEHGLRGPHLRLFQAVGRVHPRVLGRRLPLNGAGVCGAALADLGLAPELQRAVALLARAAGLIGHLAEELRRPIAGDIYATVQRNARYLSPGEPTG